MNIPSRVLPCITNHLNIPCLDYASVILQQYSKLSQLYECVKVVRK